MCRARDGTTAFHGRTEDRTDQSHRVEWVNHPGCHPTSAAAALMNGEIDWYDDILFDLIPHVEASRRTWWSRSIQPQPAIWASCGSIMSQAAVQQPCDTPGNSRRDQPGRDHCPGHRGHRPRVDVDRQGRRVLSGHRRWRRMPGSRCFRQSAGLRPSVKQALAAAGYNGEARLLSLCVRFQFTACRQQDNVGADQMKSGRHECRGLMSVDFGTWLQRRRPMPGAARQRRLECHGQRICQASSSGIPPSQLWHCAATGMAAWPGWPTSAGTGRRCVTQLVCRARRREHASALCHEHPTSGVAGRAVHSDRAVEGRDGLQQANIGCADRHAAVLQPEEGMMPAPRRMKLVAYLKTGPTSTHAGGWRHPAAALHDIFDPRRYEALARTLEDARFDAGFFADTFGVPDVYGGTFKTYLERGGQISYLDPMLVLPLMARVTTHLGLGATLSTTFHPPYLLARMLASLDLLTAGRAAWNVVTSATDMEARNFGLDRLPPKESRYDQGGRGAGSLLRTVGVLGRGCAGVGQGTRGVRRSGSRALRRLCRAMGAHARAAGDAAQSAGAAGVPPGRRLGARARIRRALGGGDLRERRREGGQRGVRGRYPPPGDRGGAAAGRVRGAELARRGGGRDGVDRVRACGAARCAGGCRSGAGA